MNTAAYLILVALIATAFFYFGIRPLFRVFSKVRGPRTVNCPETGGSTIVRVDVIRAALTSTVGKEDIRLRDCSRWPTKRDCGQECLLNLDVAPGDCLVNGLLMRWYRGKKCVYCRKKFEEVQWVDHRPALRTHNGKLIEWKEVKAEEAMTVLETHLPVCWDCYIAQTFRMEHPDKVVFRPWPHGSPGDIDNWSVSRRL